MPTPKTPAKPPVRVLMLMATAGGGHKSAAESITAALVAKYGSRVEVQTVDVLKEYAPQPLDKAPEFYQLMIKAPATWKGLYDMYDGVRRAKMLNSTITIAARRHTEIMLENHPADIIVSTYHFANSPVLDYLARKGLNTPFVTVVTDLVTAPPVWFDSRATLCIVPTPDVTEIGLRCGLALEQIKVIGMPVKSTFVPPEKPKSELKAALGWPTHRPAIIAMAGGEGIGSLGKIAAYLTTLDATIIVITGKNEALYHKLTTRNPPENLRVYGFVSNMQDLMQAADLIVTKAGPGTIMEALNSHLPLVLYSKLSGQEDGNVDFVTKNGAGLWLPRLHEMPGSIETLLHHPRALSSMTEAAAGLAQPGASSKIATAIGKLF